MFSDIQNTINIEYYERIIEIISNEKESTNSTNIEILGKMTNAIENAKNKKSEIIKSMSNPNDELLIDAVLSMPWKKIPNVHKINQIKIYLEENISDVKEQKIAVKHFTELINAEKLNSNDILYDVDLKKITSIYTLNEILPDIQLQLPWKRLSNTNKIDQIINYLQANVPNKKAQEAILKKLTALVNKKKFNNEKYIVYDSKIKKIISIPALKINMETKKFSISIK